MKEIEALGRKGFFAKVDVTKSAEIEVFVEEVIHRFGKIDILVNNAGIGTRGQSLETVKDEEWHEFIDGILNTVFYMSKPVARHMIARGQGGVIINIGSIAGLVISNLAPRLQRALLRRQGRSYAPDQGNGNELGGTWHSCQCHCPRLHPDRNGEHATEVSRHYSQTVGRPAHGPFWPAGRD